MLSLTQVLQTQRYFGRGILVGTAPDSPHVFLGYFLMGRSMQSQNRYFTLEGNNVQIAFLQPELVEDDSLILYPPLVHCNSQIIISNGSQTNTILQSLGAQQSFIQALRTQKFEPDAPHFTPRISALVNLHAQGFSYQMSLIKALHGVKHTACARYFYEYENLQGVGHFIHTYAHDAHPLPSFNGEPKSILMPSSLQELGMLVWEGLDAEYKVALCVQSLHWLTHEVQTLIFNKECHA
ncbi:IMP cyclohydrolase [Helicobacter baculiformis]|uniref:IMP cyclohydrolase n=1 Tax=Helicobacter baculiformis TaxID=427351 RepID=A0ABV7ZFH0_9HELI|nr:IMP cyclohydrolase [Helicobacter baculiformis]